MATLAGQRAQFTWALNQFNLTEDLDEQAKYAARMARYILAAPSNGFTAEQVTQGQSYPAAEVEKYLVAPSLAESDISEERAKQSLASLVDESQTVRLGDGNQTLYAYGYRCARDRLKIGITEGDTVQRIAAQISTSTPDKPVLLVEIKTNDCRALEKAMHGILQARGYKVSGGGAEWFLAGVEDVLDIYRFVSDGPQKR
jgi:hypothetical protein